MSKFDQWHLLEIPKGQQEWFKHAGRWPVQGYISIKSLCAQVAGGDVYRIHVVKKDTYEFYRAVKPNLVVSLGVVDRNRVWRSVSDTALHDLKVFRTILFGGKYPGPIAYLMAAKGDLVHVGGCFEAHPSAFVKRAVYKLQNTEARCSVCGERFID